MSASQIISMTQFYAPYTSHQPASLLLLLCLYRSQSSFFSLQTPSSSFLRKPDLTTDCHFLANLLCGMLPGFNGRAATRSQSHNLCRTLNLNEKQTEFSGLLLLRAPSFLCDRCLKCKYGHFYCIVWRAVIGVRA